MRLKKAYLIVLILFLFGCETDSKSTIDQQKPTTRIKKKTEPVVDQNKSDEKPSQVLPDKVITVFEIEPWKHLFFHKDKVTCFNEDSIHQFEESILKKGIDSSAVIGKLAHQIYNKTELYPWEESALEYTNYLYSIHTELGHTGIILFGMNDGWVYQLKYYSYDHLGRKVDEVPLAEWGGDGGYFRKSNGCFLNDSTYHFEFLETEYNFEKDTSEVIDSEEVKYIIHENGEIDKTLVDPE